MQRISEVNLSDIAVMDFLAAQESQDIHAADHWRDALIHRLRNPIVADGLKLPWPKTFDKVRLRGSEVSVWFGRSGAYKSTLMGQVASWATLETRVGIMSFEMPVDVTLERMVKQAAGTARPTERYAHAFIDHLADRMWIYDHDGLVLPERVLACAHYMASLGIKLVIIDCLIMVKGVTRDSEKEAEFMGHLTALAKIHNIHIALVHHPRKGDGRADPNRLLTRDDLRGASDLADMASLIVVVHHNKIKKLALEKQGAGQPLTEQEQESLGMPCQVLSVDKNRNTPFEGPIGLSMKREAMQFRETPNSSMFLDVTSAAVAA